MIRIHQVKCSSAADIESQILKKLKMPKRDLLSWSVHRKSVDARGQKVLFSFIIDAEVRNETKYLKHKDVKRKPDENFRFEPTGTRPLKNRPIVAGAGPAGLFAALLLAQYGYRPILIDRGSEIEKRQKDVDTFWKTGVLDPESNVQFGMGGAGAFSDGKLTTRSKDLRSRKVYEELVRFGASPSILTDKHPHVGTDGFVVILKNMIAEIERLGGSVLFDTRLEDIVVIQESLSAVVLNPEGTVDCQALIAAVGHSAGTILKTLHDRGVNMEPKSFAVGVRIEHLQSFINQAMLKDQAFNPDLIPARYQLSWTASNDKGVYSFCMCPGGYVIPSSSSPQTVVVNGMSYSDRGGTNANAAMLVQTSMDPDSKDVFAGEAYLSRLEKKAYDVSGSYKAPVQLAADYLSNRKSTAFKSVKPTYELGTVFADFNEIFDEPTNQALHEALNAFEKQIPGFLKDALLTGVETRSSSSLRIVRDRDSLMSNVLGLYPCGEGAGYSGGIMTSAIDGLKCAMALMSTFTRPEEV